jgi:hypothetical protein
VTRRIKIKGIRRELDADQLAFVYFTMAKRRVQEKRRREEAERTKRQCKEGRRDR